MPVSSRTEKILYIVNHPELLSADKTELANALKKVGLVSYSTSPVDLQPKRLIDEAKKVIAEQKAGPK